MVVEFLELRGSLGRGEILLVVLFSRKLGKQIQRAKIHEISGLSIENKFRGYSPPPGKNLGGFSMKNSPPPNLEI